METARRQIAVFNDTEIGGRQFAQRNRSSQYLQSAPFNILHIFLQIEICNFIGIFQAFESITVLFVELANVDEITATNAMEAVTCMNAVFSCFDNIIDQHNVYKVFFDTFLLKLHP